MSLGLVFPSLGFVSFSQILLSPLVRGVIAARNKGLPFALHPHLRVPAFRSDLKYDLI